MAQEGKIKLNLSLFSKESLLFVITLALGVFVAVKLQSEYQFSASTVEPLEFAPGDVAMLAVFFFAFSVIMLKFRRVAGIMLRLFFLLVVFSGSNIALESLIPFPHSLFLALTITVFLFLGSNLFIHNLAVILGVAGLSAVLGVSLKPTSAGMLLGILSIYDVIAVYRTKHMVAMAENMIASGAVFGFLVPFKWRYFWTSISSARIGQHIMILGSGDIGLPVVFSASLVSVSAGAALSAAAGSVVGLFITHLLFTNQSERRPMAALPPIAAMSIIGYIFYLIFQG